MGCSLSKAFLTIGCLDLDHPFDGVLDIVVGIPGSHPWRIYVKVSNPRHVEALILRVEVMNVHNRLSFKNNLHAGDTHKNITITHSYFVQ